MAMLQPVAAEGARYEVFPEPDVRKTATNWVSSAYVVDKRDNQLWVCTARYDFTSKEPNKGECSKLPSDIGRHSLNESYATHGVVGLDAARRFFPVVWFIEPATGDVLRAAGICLRLRLS
jgi:hypothetical protein